MFNVGNFWAAILSGERQRTQSAYWSLPNEDERLAVYEHLKRMATEPDWAEVQRQAALAALEAIHHIPATDDMRGDADDPNTA